MKIKHILFTLCLLINFSLNAQNEKTDEKREKIKEYKVAFLTTELELTSSEAQKFWPIYNAYDDKQFDLRHNKIKNYLRKLDDNNINSLSEKEAATYLSQIESADKELYVLKEKYNANLKKILSAKKILKLKKSEDDFNRKLLKQYRDKAAKN